jgi:hypothetical protein
LRTKIIDLIQSVNTLDSFVESNEGTVLPPKEYDDLIVGEDVATFEPSTIFPEGSDGGDRTSPIQDNPCFVPLTRVLEIRNVDLPNPQKLASTRKSINWSPSFSPLVIFNKGYGYVVELFREIFPEFLVSVHDRFPKVPLAEDMLWYQMGNLSDGKILDVSTMIEKVRVFFGCSFSQNPTLSVQDVNVPLSRYPTLATDEFVPSRKNFRYKVIDDHAPVGTWNIPTSHNKYITDLRGKAPSIPSPPCLSSWNKSGSHYDHSLSLLAPNEWNGNRCISSDIPDLGPVPSTLLTQPDPTLPQLSIPMHTHCPIEPLDNPPAAKVPSVGLSVADSYASPFHVDPSPCKDAFINKGNIWGNETRKEMSDVTIHAEKRILLREFVDKKCHVFQGAKVKSSKLFEIFKNFYSEKNINIPFEKAFNQTSFTVIMKQVSNFETKREKDGMYWTDLHVGNKPPDLTVTKRVLQPKVVKPMITKVNIDIDTEGRAASDSVTFAEFFQKKKD